MPDKNTQGLETTQETVEPAKDLTIDEIKAQAKAEAMAEIEGKYKNEISTRDQKLTQYQKDLKARMTEEERIKAQAEEERKEWLNDIAKTKADALQLDEKHSALIKGSNKEEISSSAEMVKSLIETVSKEKDKTIKALEDRIKILEANGTPPPSGSPTVTATLQTQFNEAKKLNDLPMQMAIKRQAQREGFVINE